MKSNEKESTYFLWQDSLQEVWTNFDCFSDPSHTVLTDVIAHAGAPLGGG